MNGIEGIPGSGKSYEAVVYHVLHALRSGRLVITNLPLIVSKFTAIDPAYGSLINLRTRAQPIRGTWNPEAVDENGQGNAFTLFDDDDEDKAVNVSVSRHSQSGRVVHHGRTVEPDVTVSPFGHVWDYWTEWRHPQTGQGPLFVIDECHVPLPKLGTDKQVIQWFKLHRHFNVDVLLMTQSFRDMDQSIARVMEMLIRCRKATFLGKPTKYIRKVFAGYRGALISTEERDYKPQFFGLYKSHTQGNSVAESLAPDVQPFLVRFKRWSWVVIAAGAAITAYTVYGASTRPKLASTSKTQTVSLQPGQPAFLPVPAASGPVFAASAAASVTVQVPEPYQTKSFHLTGHIKMGARELYTFTVSQNGLSISSVTDSELHRAGYKWVPLTDCAGILYWQDKAMPVTCDVPQVSMAMGGAPVKAGEAVASASP